MLEIKKPTDQLVCWLQFLFFKHYCDINIASSRAVPETSINWPKLRNAGPMYKIRRYYLSHFLGTSHYNMANNKKVDSETLILGLI